MTVKSYTPWEVAQEALPYLAEEGRLTPFRALARFFTSAELLTAATPAVQVDIGKLGQPGPPNPLMQWLRPTVVLRGPAGEAVVAPHGPAPAGGAAVLAAGVVLVLGGTFALGYAAGRAQRGSGK